MFTDIFLEQGGIKYHTGKCLALLWMWPQTGIQLTPWNLLCGCDDVLFMLGGIYSYPCAVRASFTVHTELLPAVFAKDANEVAMQLLENCAQEVREFVCFNLCKFSLNSLLQLS